jgi:hypothetical protein
MAGEIGKWTAAAPQRSRRPLRHQARLPRADWPRNLIDFKNPVASDNHDQHINFMIGMSRHTLPGVKRDQVHVEIGAGPSPQRSRPGRGRQQIRKRHNRRLAHRARPRARGQRVLRTGFITEPALRWRTARRAGRGQPNHGPPQAGLSLPHTGSGLGRSVAAQDGPGRRCCLKTRSKAERQAALNAEAGSPCKRARTHNQRAPGGMPRALAGLPPSYSTRKKLAWLIPSCSTPK